MGKGIMTFRNNKQLDGVILDILKKKKKDLKKGFLIMNLEATTPQLNPLVKKGIHKDSI